MSNCIWLEPKGPSAPALERTARLPQTDRLALSAHTGPCIGCPGCDGICAALLEAAVVPDIVLRD